MISEDISLIGKPHLENISENEQHLFTRVIQSTEESVLSYSKLLLLNYNRIIKRACSKTLRQRRQLVIILHGISSY